MFKRNKNITKSLQIGNSRIPRDYYIEISEGLECYSYRGYLIPGDDKPYLIEWHMSLMNVKTQVNWDISNGTLKISNLYNWKDHQYKYKVFNVFDMLNIIKTVTVNDLQYFWI